MSRGDLVKIEYEISGFVALPRQRHDEQADGDVGTELVRRSIDVARAEKLKRVISNILPENVEMRAVCKRLARMPDAAVEALAVSAVPESSTRRTCCRMSCFVA